MFALGGRVPKEYLAASPIPPSAPPLSFARFTPHSAPHRLTLAQLAKALDTIEVEEATFEENTSAKINSLQIKLNEALDEQQAGRNDIRCRKDAIKSELHKRTRNDTLEDEPARASPIPECPVCYEEMRPPKEIWTCGNGHLICSDCQPDVRDNKCVVRCGSKYSGKAIAMEQLVRQILGIM